MLETRTKLGTIFIREAIENEKYDYCNRSKGEKCVEIAENFAIGFGKWLSDNNTHEGNIKELLEIYKKTL